ncbi:unnamed protein product [Choristocarpus tenellus]
MVRNRDVETGEMGVKPPDSEKAHNFSLRRLQCSLIGILMIFFAAVGLHLLNWKGPSDSDPSLQWWLQEPIGSSRGEWYPDLLGSGAAVNLESLILVPGHGVTLGESLNGADKDDARWYLLDYQKGHDVPEALVGHIKGGLEAMVDDPSALLIFSGGPTRAAAGPKSEGEAYFFVAEHFGWWGHPELRARTVIEDFARDSFENILFSLCRF